jgi:hypothetical protein
MKSRFEAEKFIQNFLYGPAGVSGSYRWNFSPVRSHNYWMRPGAELRNEIDRQVRRS